MKKVNLKFAIKDLEGNVMGGGENAAKLVANELVRSESKEPIKIMDWGISLSTHGHVYLDTTDYDKFKDAVNNLKLIVLAKAPILIAINEAKEQEVEAVTREKINLE